MEREEMSSGVVPVLACVLNQLCVSNDEVSFNPRTSSKFHALRIPSITLKDYLGRVARYSGCSTECFILALVYIDRIIQCCSSFVVNSYSIHRLIVTSVMLAAKFFDDHYYNNAYYAKIGGVSYTEMNSLEIEFLFMLNFDLFVTTETYEQYYKELWSHASNESTCCIVKVPPLILPVDTNARPKDTSPTSSTRKKNEITRADRHRSLSHSLSHPQTHPQTHAHIDQALYSGPQLPNYYSLCYVTYNIDLDLRYRGRYAGVILS